MLSSKSKSVILETSANKAAPSTPRASKLGRAGAPKADFGSPSPQQAPRVSIDRSPRSVDQKPIVERRSPRISTPDKQSRAIKGSEVHTQLGAAQEDVKKAKEKLGSVENEKNRLLEELKAAKKSADEANEKLQEALAAQKKAEEASEIDKFRADEMEQASIEAMQKREEEWQREFEKVRNQHALDMAALLATSEELQKVKQELSTTTEAKNSALSRADDGMKIAEINADKVELLSGEVCHLKTLLDSAKESKSTQAPELQKNALNLQAQLIFIQEELKNANERLASVEMEKTEILEELKETKRLSYEANEKLKEDLVLQTRTHEALEIEMNRADELKQESIKAAQKREEKWQKELESIQNQHDADIAAFCSTREELERMKHELATITDEKNAAMSQADDAMRIAEVNAEKVKLLSEEISQLEAMLDSKSQLHDEVSSLKNELERAKEADKKLLEMEELIHELKTEISNRKKVESDAGQLTDEWKKKVEQLEVHLEEANQSTKSSLDYVASIMKQLEERNNVLEEKERELSTLKEKVELLELDVARCKADLDESSQQLDVAREETSKMNKTIEILKSDLQIADDAKMHVLNDKKIAASKVESLMEEKNKLINELESTQSDLEKVKTAKEGLASALHEVSMEAREAHTKFLAKQAEVEDALAQIEDFKLTIEKTRETYEVELGKAKYEIDHLKETVQRFKMEAENSKSEWDIKEVDFVSSITKSEKEITKLRCEMDKMVESLEGAELQVLAAKEGEFQVINKLKQLESEAIVAKRAAEEASDESFRLKEMLLDKENELQNICQENDDLRIRETAALKKVEELSALLADTTTKKPQENKPEELHSLLEPSQDINHSELPKAVDNSQENTREEDEADNTMSDVSTGKIKDNRSQWASRDDNGNDNGKDECPELEGKMQENGKIIDKDLLVEKERKSESVDHELDTKIDSIGNDLANGSPSDNIESGANSPSKHHQQQKKKKAFMQRFGSLLKKKSNHK